MNIPPLLPFGASFALDLIVISMALIVPTLIYSIKIAEKAKYAQHKRFQQILTVALAIVVVLFEIEIRMFGWLHLIDAHWNRDASLWTLKIHLVFAISTAILWVWTFTHAALSFPQHPRPNQHSKKHKRLGKLSVVGMLLTALTGWTFYIVSFVIR